MRHGKKVNHLGRTASHRKAMLSNMATSLIKNKRISTTVAKAKELRKYVEPLITRSKSDTIHNRRVVFSYLQDKESVTILFNEVSEKVASRQGGYTRIIKVGARLGDAAEMCIIELVDYNTLVLEETTEKSKSSTRRRRSKSKSTANDSNENKEEVKAEATDVKAEKSDDAENSESKNESADDQSEKKDAE